MTTDQLKIIEQNHLGHFAYLPKNLGFDVHEISGVAVINCNLETSMFNIAYGSPKAFDFSIYEIKQAFRGQPFAWWIPQTQYNSQVTQALVANGFISETVEHAMICDLSNVTHLVQKTGLVIQQVTNSVLLQDFISVLESYDSHVSAFYGRMNDELLLAAEKLVIGYTDDKPVTIGSLFVSGNSAGIFSLITKEEEQRKGYGADMMIFLMKIAQDHSCHSVTLSASSDSGYRIYERLGFFKAGKFECFEYKGDQT